MKPSYIALSISGILLGVFLFIIIRDMFRKKVYNTDDYQMLILLVVTSIAVGVHGLGHAYAEVNFNFDPLKNNRWVY